MIAYLSRSATPLALLIALVTTSAQAAEPNADKNAQDGLHIYLLIGQSNMAGRAKVTEEIAGVIEGGYLLNDKNQFIPAKNPLNLYSTIRKGEGMQKLGPGYSFAVEMIKADPEKKVGLVVNARGGSKIEQWQRDARYYKDLLKRAKSAQEAGTIKGILWHQGESNSNNPEAYLPQLKSLIANLREDLGDGNLPFVAGQVNHTPPLKINDVIAELPDAVSNTAVVSSEGLKCYDRWHFDTESQLELGKRYAKAMLTLSQAPQTDEASN